MLSRRIIACLDVRGGMVVKGNRFKNHEIVGEVLALSRKYSTQGIDELVFYEITASPEGRTVSPDWIRAVAREIDIPFCVAGGIRTLEQAEKILNAGADKISVNSPALERPELISELATRFGTQCVVVGVDSKKDPSGDWIVHQYTGDVEKSSQTKRKMLEWIVEAQDRGAGEVVLNCMDADGTGEGYDIEQIKAARTKLSIPLVASGGAKTIEHFERVFKDAKADAALAAGAFHRGELQVPKLKAELKERGVSIRYANS